MRASKLFKRKEEPTSYDESMLQIVANPPAHHADTASLSLLYNPPSQKSIPANFRCRWFIKSSSDLTPISQSPSCRLSITDIGKELTYQLEPQLEGKEYEGMPITGTMGIVHLSRTASQDLDFLFKNSFVALCTTADGQQCRFSMSSEGSALATDHQTLFDRKDWWPQVTIPNRQNRSQLKICLPSKQQISVVTDTEETSQRMWAVSRCFIGHRCAKLHNMLISQKVGGSKMVMLYKLSEWQVQKKETAKELQDLKEKNMSLQHKQQVTAENLSSCTKNYYELDRKHVKLLQEHDSLIERMSFMQNQIRLLQIEKDHSSPTPQVPTNLQQQQHATTVIEKLQLQLQNCNEVIESLMESKGQAEKDLEEAMVKVKALSSMRESTVEQLHKLEDKLKETEVQKKHQNQLMTQIQHELKSLKKRKKNEESVPCPTSSSSSQPRKSQMESLMKLANRLAQQCADKDLQIAGLRQVNKQLASKL